MFISIHLKCCYAGVLRSSIYIISLDNAKIDINAFTDTFANTDLSEVVPTLPMSTLLGNYLDQS